MKRFFSTMLLLAAAFAVVSCDKNNGTDDGTDDYVGTKYTGSTYVTASYGGNEGTYESEDTVAYLNVKESSVDLTIAKACFTKDIPFVSSDYQMPSLDIVLPDIANASGTRYAASSVTPTMLDGEPYGNDIIKSIDNVMVYIDGDYIDVSFDCTVYINLTGTGSQDFTFTIEFNNYEAPLVTTPTIPTTTAEEDYVGNVFTYSLAASPKTLLYSTDTNDIEFSLIESGESATLVARDFKFTPSPDAPLMTMVIGNLTADYDSTSGDPTPVFTGYDGSDLTGNIFIYDSYYTTAEITSVDVFWDEDETLGVLIEIVWNDGNYEISFYNQDEAGSTVN
ncbi:MAG: hypothetical protein R3Y68_08105 [Rikenellaceae bacterium]